jgi:hypothetical protein
MLDIVAQDCPTGVDIPRQHGGNSFAQKSFGERRFFRRPALHQFLEAFFDGRIACCDCP